MFIKKGMVENLRGYLLQFFGGQGGIAPSDWQIEPFTTIV